MNSDNFYSFLKLWMDGLHHAAAELRLSQCHAAQEVLVLHIVLEVQVNPSHDSGSKKKDLNTIDTNNTIINKK